MPMRDLLLLNQNFKLKRKCLSLPCLCRDPQLVNGRTSWRLMVPEQSQCALLSPLHKGGFTCIYRKLCLHFLLTRILKLGYSYNL